MNAAFSADSADSAADGGRASAADGGRAWLAELPDELAAQRRVMSGLVDLCEQWPLAVSFLVGCSLGRGAGDALSDIDAALGVDVPAGQDGAAQVSAAEELVVAALPEFGGVVDVLRHQIGPARRIFAQFDDGTQLDLAVLAHDGIESRWRAGGAPDFVFLYRASPGGSPAEDSMTAYAVTGQQVREWAFLGWCALADLDKYQRRGSRWEAHSRLHEARQHIWQLWAAANGAMYPWHGLSQVLDHDPGNLPPGISYTVARLDLADLRRAARASAEVLTAVSSLAAERYPAELPEAMAAYVTERLQATR
jgi:hypothetical protein